MRFHRLLIQGALALLALSGASVTMAQERAPKPNGEVIVEERIAIEAPRVMGQEDVIVTPPTGANTFIFLASEMSFDQKIVKGAPYSAEATTETVQTLSDGNRIVRKNSASISRDGEGRTRREQTLGMIGQWGAAGDPPKTIFINDPVAGVNYILEPRTRTARKLNFPRLEQGARFELQRRAEVERRVQGERFEIQVPAPGPGAAVRVMENGAQAERERTRGPAPVVEQLGKRSIEGVDAEGTRKTITIPAGHIGNERPIEIVEERWYSPELQTVVLSTRKDPMAGETTYRLTNINRGEPARSLFEVPGDYTIKETPQQFNWRTRVRPETN